MRGRDVAGHLAWSLSYPISYPVILQILFHFLTCTVATVDEPCTVTGVCRVNGTHQPACGEESGKHDDGDGEPLHPCLPELDGAVGERWKKMEALVEGRILENDGITSVRVLSG